MTENNAKIIAITECILARMSGPAASTFEEAESFVYENAGNELLASREQIEAGVRDARRALDQMGI